MSAAAERIRAVLEPLQWVNSAWLYGSRAKGQARPDSDWDIAVLLANPAAPALVQRLHEDLEDALRGEVGLAVLNGADSLLCREAIDGQLLLTRNPGAQAQFVSRICRIAEDDQIRLRRALGWWKAAQA